MNERLRDAPPTLSRAAVTLRPGGTDDLGALLTILAEPFVACWWGTPETAEGLADRLEGSDDALLLVVEVEGAVAGGIELWEELDPDYRHAGIDVFLGERWQGRRLGRSIVSLAVAHLLESRGHHRVTIDPSTANERAIRCYRAVGFRPVGVLRSYERGPDGTWRDGLLMDLLPDELVEW